MLDLVSPRVPNSKILVRWKKNCYKSRRDSHTQPFTSLTHPCDNVAWRVLLLELIYYSFLVVTLSYILVDHAIWYYWDLFAEIHVDLLFFLPRPTWTACKINSEETKSTLITCESCETDTWNRKLNGPDIHNDMQVCSGMAAYRYV